MFMKNCKRKKKGLKPKLQFKMENVPLDQSTHYVESYAYKEQICLTSSKHKERHLLTPMILAKRIATQG